MSEYDDSQVSQRPRDLGHPPAFMYDFHNGMKLAIAVKRRYFPDGAEFEGMGIKPDIEVHTSIEDLKRDRDSVLERALEFAGNERNTKSR